MFCNKIIFSFLMSNFLLFSCKPMDLKTNLTQLKGSLGQLKAKLGTLNAKLVELKESIEDQGYGDQPYTAKKIVIDSKEYCTCEFWNLPKLRNYVKKNCKPFAAKNRAFNVIDRVGNSIEKATDLAMKDPKFNGAVFQLAANDSVAGTWVDGRSHAGYMVDRTNLGTVIRNDKKYTKEQLNEFFHEPSLNEKYQKQQDIGLSSWVPGGVCLNTLQDRAENVDEIIVAINFNEDPKNLIPNTDPNKPGLRVEGLPAQFANIVLTAAYSSPQLPRDEKRMKNCVKVGYDGVLLSAIRLGVPKVVLTIIGGHVFHGFPPYIIDAIENAVKKYAVKYNLNVTLYLDDSKFNWDDPSQSTQKACDDRLRALRKEINGSDKNIDPIVDSGNLFVSKDIKIDGKEYCKCEFWKVSELEKYVTNKCKAFSGKPAFNVIDRTNNKSGYKDFTEKATSLAMKDPKFSGAVFQLASNDNVPYVWFGGRSHAGYIVNRTVLGAFIRNNPNYKICNSCKSGGKALCVSCAQKCLELNKIFNDPTLPKSNASRCAGCAALGTADENPTNKNNIFVAMHSGIDVATSGNKINVVFTAAYDKPNLPKDALKVNNCLTAGYDGILLSAIKLGSRKVVLTFIGCHAFGGNPGNTTDAIEKAVRAYVKKYNLNVTVYLDDAQFNGGGTQQLADDRLRALRKEINGSDKNIDPDA